MIHYALKCDRGHDFDSWFQSAAAFDALARAGHLACAHCGSDQVKKAVMAPRVGAKSTDRPPPGGTGTDTKGTPVQEGTVPMLKNPQGDIQEAVAALRKQVEDTSDYVGEDFTRQARDMHLGNLPERAIYGEARPDQARSLIEDGVPLLPLPFKPRRKLS